MLNGEKRRWMDRGLPKNAVKGWVLSTHRPGDDYRSKVTSTRHEKKARKKRSRAADKTLQSQCKADRSFHRVDG